MFAQMPDCVRQRMTYLEQIDTRDRTDGTPRMERLRQVPPEIGKFISLLALAAPAGEYIEIGTSAGYSTLWLALACQQLGRRITTFETLPEKIRMAKATFALTNLVSVVDLVEGDARDYIRDLSNISFCFLDAEKEVYKDCYDLSIPRMTPGGLLVADNAINHRETLQPMIDAALTDPRVDAMVVPVGKGELICRKK